MIEDVRGPEPLGQLLLVGETRDRVDPALGVEPAQNGDRAETERAATPHEDRAARLRRPLEDPVEGHGEGVREHRRLVRDVVRHRDRHRFVGGDERGESAGRRARVSGVDPRREMAANEVRADREVAVAAGVTRRIDAARTARQPRVQDDPVADAALANRRADPDHSPHHLVPENLWEGDERGHGIVEAALQEHLLGVAPADAAVARLDHQPIVRREGRLGDVLEQHG